VIGDEGAELDVHVQRFSVSYEYPVVFTRDALSLDNRALRSVIERAHPPGAHRIAAVVDRGVAEHWPNVPEQLSHYASAHADTMELTAPMRVMPGGEAAKNDPTLLTELHRWFFDLGLDRHSVVIAIGGGALLDLIGYATSTTHRGLRLVRMPTTVLAQNDAGIGVKNGINAYRQKNGLGTFDPPHGVINDAAFLRTLPVRDRRAGMAEAVKVALIRDASFFEWLTANEAALARLEEVPLEALIRRCARLHLEHIASSGDAFERGNARPLDYGHWAAHKLELLSEHELRHGEAVSIGMAIDTLYAAEIGILDQATATRVIELLRALALPIWHAAIEQRNDEGRLLVSGIDEFRQHLGGALCLPMLTAIGSITEVSTVDPWALERTIDRLKALA
jgi:3-dehydroquinate synthase